MWPARSWSDPAQARPGNIGPCTCARVRVQITKRTSWHIIKRAKPHSLAVIVGIQHVDARARGLAS